MNVRVPSPVTVISARKPWGAGVDTREGATPHGPQAGARGTPASAQKCAS